MASSTQGLPPPSPSSRVSNYSDQEFLDFDLSRQFEKVHAVKAWLTSALSISEKANRETFDHLSQLAVNCPDDERVKLIANAMEISANEKKFNPDLKKLIEKSIEILFPNYSVVTPTDSAPRSYSRGSDSPPIF